MPPVFDDEANGVDEGLFLEMIVANERVAQWIEKARGGKKSALIKLLEAVRENDAYAEEARREGAVQAMTNLLSRSSSACSCSACSWDLTPGRTSVCCWCLQLLLFALRSIHTCMHAAVQVTRKRWIWQQA